jgi:hypothetical protein
LQSSLYVLRGRILAGSKRLSRLRGSSSLVLAASRLGFAAQLAAVETPMTSLPDGLYFRMIGLEDQMEELIRIRMCRVEGPFQDVEIDGFIFGRSRREG